MHFYTLKHKRIYWLAIIVALLSVLLFGGYKFLHLYLTKIYKHHVLYMRSGLGNQMFEYAWALAMKKETGKDVLLDTNFYKKTNALHEKLFLKHYNVDNIFFDSAIRHFFEKKFLKKNIDDIVVSSPFDYNRGLSGKMQKGVFVMKQTFQNYKWFDKYRDEVITHFQLKTPLDKKNKEMLKEIKKYKNSVSLHIRRGDYHEWGLPILSSKYFETAMKEFFDGKYDVHYFIFTNDAEWVKKNIKFNRPYTIVGINDALHPYYDIYLMSQCKHNIIANSSFSWWGAYLNQNKGKIVVAPRLWVDNISSDWLCPPDWKFVYTDGFYIGDERPTVRMLTRKYKHKKYNNNHSGSYNKIVNPQQYYSQKYFDDILSDTEKKTISK